MEATSLHGGVPACLRAIGFRKSMICSVLVILVSCGGGGGSGGGGSSGGGGEDPGVELAIEYEYPPAMQAADHWVGWSAFGYEMIRDPNLDDPLPPEGCHVAYHNIKKDDPTGRYVACTLFQ